MISQTASLRNDDWLLLSPLLDHALELEAEEREEWIHAQEPEIASRLEVLLLEYSVLTSGRFLENSFVDRPSTTATLVGQTVGAFEVMSQIGQGGMGSVWLARRNDGRFERQVALKFVNIALLGKEGEERFKREGKILALLADPHIAELIDAGVTQAGQPYLVLEYVDGEHIDRYCDRHQLDIESRIRLFLQVLDAVATAHANLIVHRDLKPSNVLVRKDGHVKLLDFGIAKLIQGENGAGPQTVFTIEGTALTPEYAAPEQLKREAITIATDVYSLGVLLYGMLTGQHPYGDARCSPADLVHSVVYSDPLRPSDAVAVTVAKNEPASAQALTQATARASSMDKLRRTLQGDLDTIVLKALKKEPRERYSSVSALAEDLRRYLRCEPVRARPDTLLYRAQKFFRRNLTAVALAAVAFTGVALGVAGTLLQARTARTQRDLALRQLARAERMTDLNELLLSEAAPMGRPLAVDQLLEREQRVIERERNLDSANHVELQLSLGTQYSSKDQNEKALRVVNEAYRLSRDLKEPAIRAKASCVLAGAMVPVGELARAEALYQEGLHELANRAEYNSERATCLWHGSEIASRNGSSEEAIQRARAAEQAIQDSQVQWSLEALNVSINLATVLGDAGRFREADRVFEQASGLMTNLGYDDSQKAVKLFNNWALVLSYDGRQLDAEKTYRRALDISRDDQTNDAVAPLLLYNYASLLRELGRNADVAGFLNLADVKASQFDDKILLDDIDLLRAQMYTDAHQLDKASELLTELEQRLRGRYAPEHYVFAEVASERSRIALALGSNPAAREYARLAVELDEASIRRIGQCSAYLPTLLTRKSQVEFQSGHLDMASADARRALDLLKDEEAAGIPSSNIGRAYLASAQALQAGGKQEQAQTASRNAYENLLTTLGPDHADTLIARELADSRMPSY